MFRWEVYSIGLATKWLRILSRLPIDRIRNHLCGHCKVHGHRHQQRPKTVRKCPASYWRVSTATSKTSRNICTGLTTNGWRFTTHWKRQKSANTKNSRNVITAKGVLWRHSITELSNGFATQSSIPSKRKADMPNVPSIFLRFFRRILGRMHTRKNATVADI